MHTPTVSWSDLKSQYFYNLMTLQNSITVAHNSTIEMNRIYSEVIKKAKDSSPETMKLFIVSWLKKIDVDNMEQFTSLKKESVKLLDAPSEENFKDFGLALQQQLQKEYISFLDVYSATMNAFYDTWKEMWPN